MISLGAKAEVIDADAHVVETEQSWNYLEAAEQKYRLTLAPSPEPTQSSETSLPTNLDGFTVCSGVQPRGQRR